MAGLRKNSKAEEKEELQELEVTESPVEELVEEEAEVEVKAKHKAKAEPNVRIKPNQDLRTYIGDQWYSLKKGEVQTVPANVKEILQRANMLDAL
jgi:formylmethanofuran dehydrogenase subunit C